MALNAPDDVWHEIVAALGRLFPTSLRALAWALPEIADITKEHRYRVLCVQSTGRVQVDDPFEGSETRRMGIPVLSYRRFEQLRPEQMRLVRHLHLTGITFHSDDALDPVFGGCPLMETLWIDHWGTGELAPAVRGLQRLRTLRELTLSVVYLTEAAWLENVVLPAVTHLHLQPIVNEDALDWPTLLRAFPNLTHLGFAAQHGSVRAAARVNDAWGVLVRVHDDELDAADVCVDQRVVYLRYSGPAMDDHDWFLRACPDWKPPGRLEPVWDQWRFFDAIATARKKGRLPPENGPIPNNARDVLAELVD
ncbi:hypothetical protein MSAN_02293300 [Mycena sanguinolenta]|uniref:Uncharacterized protein n=1 Tax=Mycena sanguinolenta TaxID=230812 RepID=A0A8H7CHK6_9AGAR|nr:hypothetical protein MSAN_02293300 [Mycena sanguinolenta]